MEEKEKLSITVTILMLIITSILVYLTFKPLVVSILKILRTISSVG